MFCISFTRDEAFAPAREPLRALALPKLPPQEGDWLAEHPEDGQSIAQHRVDCRPVVGKTLYIVPVGTLTPAARDVLDRMEPMLAAHFQLPLKRLAPLSPAVAGKSARENTFGTQWLTTDILDGLRAVRPDDAAAVMAFTEVDLYPDPAWNFVFGQASYDHRVGVMSIARTGDVVNEQTLVLMRSYQTGMHEMGHMLQVLHCIAWECPMNGCNHQQESDTRPIEPCPHCLAKLMLATGLDPDKRRRELRALFADAGIERGVAEIDAQLAVLDGGR